VSSTKVLFVRSLSMKKYLVMDLMEKCGGFSSLRVRGVRFDESFCLIDVHMYRCMQKKKKYHVSHRPKVE